MKDPRTNKKKQKGKKKASGDGQAPMEAEKAPATPSVWRPGQDPIEVSFYDLPSSNDQVSIELWNLHSDHNLTAD